MNSLRRQLAAKLSIGITLLTIPIFVVALGILFLYSHHLLYQDTATHANNILQNRLLRLNRTPVTCQVVTDSVEMSNIKLGFSVDTTANGDTLFYYSRALRPDGDAVKGIVTAGLPIKRLKTIIKQAEQPFPVCEFLLLENDQTFDTEDAHVFYDELPDTDWTLALICPDSTPTGHWLLYVLTANSRRAIASWPILLISFLSAVCCSSSLSAIC